MLEPPTPVASRCAQVRSPLKGLLAHAHELVAEHAPAVGAVLVEACVALVAALHAYDDQGFLPAVEEVLKAPALAVGGAFVVEEVVPVEEVHHRIALL